MRKSLVYQTHSCKSLVLFLIENPDILFVFDQTKKSYLPIVFTPSCLFVYYFSMLIVQKAGLLKHQLVPLSRYMK